MCEGEEDDSDDDDEDEEKEFFLEVVYIYCKLRSITYVTFTTYKY